MITSTEAREKVYAALEAEADMDGFITVTLLRLAELSGYSHVTAYNAVNDLVCEGRLEIVARGRGVREVNPDGSRVYAYGEYQLLSEAYA